MTKIVALSGYARSGKDTAAQALLDAGWKRLSFADKMREAALALDPIVEVIDTDYTLEEPEPLLPPLPVRLSTHVSNLGWTRAKQVPEVRRFLQRLGTEMGRNLFGENFWVDIALKDAPKGNLVVTDLRYPNEADAIRQQGGMVIRVERSGVGPVNDHPTEHSLDDYRFDYTLLNNWDIDSLQRNLLEVVNGWFNQRSYGEYIVRYVDPLYLVN